MIFGAFEITPFKLGARKFFRMVDQRKALRLISDGDHCQIFSLLEIYGTPRAEFQPVQNLSMKICSSDNHHTLFLSDLGVI